MTWPIINDNTDVLGAKRKSTVENEIEFHPKHQHSL